MKSLAIPIEKALSMLNGITKTIDEFVRKTGIVIGKEKGRRYDG